MSPLRMGRCVGLDEIVLDVYLGMSTGLHALAALWLQSRTPLHDKQVGMQTSEPLEEATGPQYLGSLLGCSPRIPDGSGSLGCFSSTERETLYSPLLPQIHRSWVPVKPQVEKITSVLVIVPLLPLAALASPFCSSLLGCGLRSCPKKCLHCDESQSQITAMWTFKWQSSLIFTFQVWGSATWDQQGSYYYMHFIHIDRNRGSPERLCDQSKATLSVSSKAGMLTQVCLTSSLLSALCKQLHHLTFQSHCVLYKHLQLTEPYNQWSVRKLIQKRRTLMAKVTEVGGKRIRTSTHFFWISTMLFPFCSAFHQGSKWICTFVCVLIAYLWVKCVTGNRAFCMTQP